jgi:hypothetical protein
MSSPNASGWDFDEFLMTSGLSDEEEKQIRDVAVVIYAGLDQARSELGMGWKIVSHKRMTELAQRVAVETVDWTRHEGLLVGTWMAASSRTQILHDQEG